MSMGNGATSATVSPARSNAFEVNPNRDHAAGPLAVLFTVEPDQDPLLAISRPGSPSKTSLRGSPFDDNVNASLPLEATIQPGTPRTVSALANLERAAVPSSPNRSLLSAFQAVSPRSTHLTTASRSTSAPSLSSLLASPRGVLPSHSALAPASPIYTSPRQSTHKTTYATAAFRALNGASPQKQGAPSRPSSSSSASSSNPVSASLPAASIVSPVRSRSSSALRQVPNDAPTWTVYRDVDAFSAAAATSASTSTRSAELTQANPPEEGAFSLDEDLEDDFENENDENSADYVQPVNTAAPASRISDSPARNMSENGRPARPANGHSHRRSSLSMSVIPLTSSTTGGGERDVTPPPSASRWREATQGTYPREVEAGPSSISASAQRARKRLRTSGDLSV